MVYHNHMHALLEWIDENIHANLKIDDVASKSGYSKWHLQRVFSFYTGMSLGQSFTRTFRKHYSMPPACYRRTMSNLK